MAQEKNLQNLQAAPLVTAEAKFIEMFNSIWPAGPQLWESSLCCPVTCTADSFSFLSLSLSHSLHVFIQLLNSKIDLPMCPNEIKF